MKIAKSYNKNLYLLQACLWDYKLTKAKKIFQLRQKKISNRKKMIMIIKNKLMIILWKKNSKNNNNKK
jgi:hypothetical protein